MIFKVLSSLNDPSWLGVIELESTVNIVITVGLQCYIGCSPCILAVVNTAPPFLCSQVLLEAQPSAALGMADSHCAT